MAAFVNGGGDLGSTTLENAFWEAVVRARVADNALATPTGNITDDIAATGNAVTINAVIPVSTSLVGGKMTLTATNFLPAATFNPGTGGSLVSTNYPAAILEIAAKLQELEVAQNKSIVGIAFNADAGTATVTATMVVNRTVTSSGNQSFVAAAYLT